MDATKSKAWDVLGEVWRALRDDSSLPAMNGAWKYIDAFYRAGIIDDQDKDLWRLRMRYDCPGHDDEGGRDWCAYCGKMPSTPTA